MVREKHAIKPEVHALLRTYVTRSAKTEQVPKNEEKKIIINPESTSFYVQNELLDSCIRSNIKKL